jgi:hypothetical protein
VSTVSAARPVRGPWEGLGIASLFLLSFGLGGISLDTGGVEYEVFGLVDGLAALLVVYVLLRSEALARPGGAWGLVMLVYGTAATAQLVGRLLPPPGVLEWLALAALVALAWHGAYGLHRSRLVLNLGLLTVAMAALRYAILPFVWLRAELPRTPVVDLYELGEAFKGLFIAYAPPHPATQAFVFAAVLAWATAVWIQWPPEGAGSWLRGLSRGERDRLLLWLVGSEAVGAIEPGRRSDHLDRPDDAE